MRSIIVAILGGLILAGCSGIADHNRLTPERIASRQIPRQAQQSRIFGTGRTPDGKVALLFEYLMPAQGSPPGRDYGLGIVVAEREHWFRWHASRIAFAHVTLYVDVEVPIDYGIYHDGYTAIYGPLPSEDIQAVEVTLSNGEISRKNTRGDFFLVFAPGQGELCELRFYGKDGELLKRKVIKANQHLCSGSESLETD